MDEKTKEIYSEVYSILNMLDKSYITRLPEKLYMMIQKEKSNKYNPQYDPNIDLSEQNIKKETLSIIALFHLNYWCNSQEEKKYLIDLFKKNEIEYQFKLREKYNPDNLFKNKKQPITKNDENKNETVDLVKYKENMFKTLIKKIKEILHFR